ncbi:hypothetical protein AN640_05995 [Candidatus Epulonipiscium fishelsonii]|uniref:Uncharacterized protein n=1 Tax=Candidatus Epulonipiscium fishelsonii TaxID=77094 RepID=A0ACC8XHX4_9FIRM|nr:hypothetical protein AN640_05995 [Epulopiscium sp. SCG-D08WGA-EpuloA1]OON94853.1 MAG: hypothetical protein ATN32_01420 [Epulopiscium sp. AS2M-Bin002]
MENNLMEQLDLLVNLIQTIISKQHFEISLVNKILKICLGIYMDMSSKMESQELTKDIEVFTELSKAIENEDYILIEDLLEYELLDIIKQWQVCMK